MAKKAAANNDPDLAQLARNPFAGLVGGSDLTGQVASRVLKRGQGRRVQPLEQIARANDLPPVIPEIKAPVEPVKPDVPVVPQGDVTPVPAPTSEPVIYPPPAPPLQTIMMGEARGGSTTPKPAIVTRPVAAKTCAPSFDKAALPDEEGDERPRAYGEETNEVKFRRLLETENQRTCLGVETFRRLLPQLLAAQYDAFVRDGGMTRSGGTGHVSKTLLTATQRIFKAFPAWEDGAKFVERNGILLDGVHIDVVMSMNTALGQVRAAKSQSNPALTDDHILARVQQLGANADNAAILLNENNRGYAISRQLVATLLWAMHDAEPDVKREPSGP